METLLDRITICRRFEWDSAHRIAGHEGPCKAIHGHRYAAEVEIGASHMDRLGRIIDFGELKTLVGDWVLANFDHTSIFDLADDDAAVRGVIELNKRMGKPAYLIEGPPTAERIVGEMASVLGPMLAARGVELRSIRLWETPNCSALWSAP